MKKKNKQLAIRMINYLSKRYQIPFISHVELDFENKRFRSSNPQDGSLHGHGCVIIGATEGIRA
jgi:hypothetical protein